MKTEDKYIPEKLLDKNNDTIDSFLLNCSNLSWDERQLIDYIRSYPDELKKIINLCKKDGEDK